MRVAVAASAMLVAAGLAAFWWASGVARKAPPPTAENAVTVTIRGNVCDPSDITVPAGRTTFTIVNQSQRALEWEILDGVMVVEERENIAPGFSQTMTAKLHPGDYAITCGLLSNPRGRLHVTPSAASDAEAARPSLVAYVGALAEYRVFLALEADTLHDAAQALADAIRAGNAQQARPLYVAAHQAYKRIEPMAELFADLDTRLNARAEYFEKREADPAFAGFHRIEHGLFAGNGTAGLAPVAGQLLADIGQLQERLRGLNIPPERLAGSAAKLLQRTADNLPAGEDRYSHADASNLQGTLDGTRKIADLLAPLLTKAAPALQQAIAQQFDALGKALDPWRDGEEFKPIPVDGAQRQALAAQVRALAGELGKVNAALGLE
ncbi:MAG: Iron uptake system component EfeO [Xylophilus sp.]|nr:MAG: Iron uptake system component EfeO [Xylophilus sp.]